MSSAGQSKFLKELLMDLQGSSKAYNEITKLQQTVVVLDKKAFVDHVVAQIYFYVYPSDTSLYINNKDVGKAGADQTLSGTQASQLLFGTPGQEFAGPTNFVEGDIFDDPTFDDHGLTGGTIKDHKALSGFREAVGKIFDTHMLAKAEKAASVPGSFSKGKNINAPGTLTSAGKQADVYCSKIGSNAFLFYAGDPEGVGTERNMYGFIQGFLFKDTNKALTKEFDNRLNPNKWKNGRPDARIPSKFPFDTKLTKKLIDVGHFYSSGNQLQFIKAKLRALAKNPLLSVDDKTHLKGLISGMTGANKSNLATRVNFGLDIEFNNDYVVSMKGGVKQQDIFIVVTPEGSGLNSGYFRRVETDTKKRLVKDIVDYVEDQGARLLNAPGSKSFTQNVLDMQVEYLVSNIDYRGKKRSNITKKRKKSPVKTNVKVKSKNLGINSGKVNLPKAVRAKKGTTQSIQDVTLNLVNIQAIINEHLPLYLKRNMGKGTAIQTLNWRTGRFANSAKLKTLVQAKGSRGQILRGQIEYMRRPYDVFRPGNKLHKPGRDPKLLIDKSIRQIMKEKALAALSFTSRV